MCSVFSLLLLIYSISQIIGQMANLEIAEIAARSGANCGSLFLDLRFRELVKTVRLFKTLQMAGNHWIDPISCSFWLNIQLISTMHLWLISVSFR